MVAIIVLEQAGRRPTLLRFGSEEFGVILPAADRASACVLAEKIRTSVMDCELVERSSGESLSKVTISVGVDEQRPGDSRSRAASERADGCLFAAKRVAATAWSTTSEPLIILDYLRRCVQAGAPVVASRSGVAGVIATDSPQPQAEV